VRPLVITSLAALVCLLPRPVPAQSQSTPVPILKASYHLPVFQNQYVTLLNIYVPPGRNTGYHIHTGESVSVNVEEADMANQNFGAPKAEPARRSQRGQPNYADYRKQTRTHKASNLGSTPFHNVSFVFNTPSPGGFTPSTRADVPAYVQVMDNERVRGWRLTLEPGQTAAAITQRAPGLRIMLTTGEIVESVPGEPDRAMNPKLGEFYWQDSGVTRSVRNMGMTPVEWLEFELK